MVAQCTTLIRGIGWECVSLAGKRYTSTLCCFEYIKWCVKINSTLHHVIFLQKGFLVAIEAKHKLDMCASRTKPHETMATKLRKC